MSDVVSDGTPLSGGRDLEVHVNAVGAVMGGAARHLGPFLTALAERRPRWELVAWVSQDIDELIVPSGVQVRTVPRVGPARRVWWESVTLPRVLRAEGADVLVNLTNSGPLRRSVPSVLYQRNPIWFDPTWVRRHGPGRFRFEAALRRWLAYAQMRVACAVVVPSRAMATYLGSWRGMTPEVRSRLVAVPHAVDPVEFPFAERAWPPAQPLRLLSVSHGAPHKNQELLPALLRVLADRGVDATLDLTVAPQDAPAYVERVRRLAVACGVEDRFRLLGRVREVRDLYATADLMVLPSFTESFGFPVVEAMASGLPVVASAIGSSIELLGDHGWFFPPDDLQAAADAVMAALATPPGRMAASLEAASGVARGLSWRANADALAGIIERCAAGRRTPRASRR
ncbi:glycosyltransferase family 4 protein [Rhabdothermincola sediminis]|uniref:glycosyltransferase family 4 protein n=1 Tax=Rhabdothermincola sediminis TaxID=2751370 RepID=UPI001AA04FEC|nr:glycosyltransferase [Rhabdothermincola sediminis]